MVLGVSRASIRKFELAGAAFGIWICFPAIFSLGYGLAGVRGNSFLSAAALVICLIAISLLLLRRVTLVAADFALVLLALSMLCTFAINPAPPSTAEVALLLVTLASYVACRFFTDEALREGRLAFAAVCIVVVGLGTIATAVALIQGWGARPKPTVLGFAAVPTHLVQVLAFLILASVTLVTPTLKRSLLIAAMAVIPVAVCSAAQVRFSFAALIVGIVLVALLSKGKQRSLVMLIGAAMVVAVVAGSLARYSKTQLLANYAVETTAGAITWEWAPSCDLKINPRNSVAIRKALALDALYLAPHAGFFGTGLDSFMRFSCVRLTQVHNSILQAVVEFGWLGGLLFLLLIAASFRSIAGLARTGSIPLFLLSSLAYLIMIAMAHGRLSRDMTLFAAMGVIAGYAESRSRREKSGEQNIGLHQAGSADV